MTKITDRAALGETLRRLRIERSISIRGLADMAGLSPATIVNIEKGSFSPRIDVVNAILSALNCKLTIEEG